MYTTVAGTTRLIARTLASDGSTIWPVKLCDLKAHAQVRHNLEDEILQQYLEDATEYIESRGQISLIHQHRRQVLDCWPRGLTIQINRGPLVSVESITAIDPAGDGHQISSGWRSDVESRTGGVYFDANVSAPPLADGPGVVWIDYTAGFGVSPQSVPAQWRQLILAVATHAYERRELATGGGFDDAFERVIARRFSAAGRNYRYV